MADRQFAKGELLFKEGDESDSAFIIESGKVEILKKGPHGDMQLAVLESGQVLGEMGLFENAPRSASARALENTNVSIIAETELDELLGRCPDRLRPIVNSVFNRLRETNQRLSAKEAADTIVECNFDKIIIEPRGEKLRGHFEPIEISVARLPFRIGGHLESENPKAVVTPTSLSLPCEGPPLAVSKRHFLIQIIDKNAVLIDRGSRYGSHVNNTPMGKGKGKYRLPLEKGSYEILFGDRNSEYQLTMKCE